MEWRALGRSGLRLPPVVLGAMDFAAGRGDDAARVRTLQAALDAGLLAIDTAPLYEFGRSERLVGRAIAGRREQVVLMTKVGLRWDGEHGEVLFPFTDDAGKQRSVRKDSRPASVKAEVDASLQRLGVERIDLLQVHHRDRQVPIADTMGALSELVRAGKVAHLGVSNYSAAEMQEAARALHPVPLASGQLLYNAVKREAERELLPYARRVGLGVLVYSPLEQGLLSAQVGPERRYPPADMRSFRASFRAPNRALINAALGRVVAPIARAHQASVAQVMLAWVIAEPGVTAAICGVSRPEQALDNVRAAELVLAPEEREQIRAAFEALVLDATEVWDRPPLWKRAVKKLLSLR